MGNRFGRKKKTEFFDPYYFPYNNPYGGGYPSGGPGYGMPPGYEQEGGLGDYDPYDVYGYGYHPSTSFESIYGRGMGMRRRSNPYAGQYGRGTTFQY
jgi:hypothetical protein